MFKYLKEIKLINYVAFLFLAKVKYTIDELLIK